MDNILRVWSPWIRGVCHLVGFEDVQGLTNDNVNGELAGNLRRDVVVLPGGFREAAACTSTTTRISCARWRYWLRKAVKYSCDLSLRVVEGATQTISQSDDFWELRHWISSLDVPCVSVGCDVSSAVRPITIHGLVERHEDLASHASEDSALRHMSNRLKSEILARFQEPVELIDCPWADHASDDARQKNDGVPR